MKRLLLEGRPQKQNDVFFNSGNSAITPDVIRLVNITESRQEIYKPLKPLTL